ncbi:hypothetical protein ANN_01151 [Periplaneta americana]|uniref:Uncharacterized protein n=1 Tax=Periplaneta americana TaxID=6978 RepID=A0ABQ8TVN9_PERAM|nr:hypothetical protein ANN_01151 [Periplaneta americana]
MILSEQYSAEQVSRPAGYARGDGGLKAERGCETCSALYCSPTRTIIIQCDETTNRKGEAVFIILSHLPPTSPATSHIYVASVYELESTNSNGYCQALVNSIIKYSIPYIKNLDFTSYSVRLLLQLPFFEGSSYPTAYKLVPKINSLIREFDVVNRLLLDKRSSAALEALRGNIKQVTSKRRKKGRPKKSWLEGILDAMESRYFQDVAVEEEVQGILAVAGLQMHFMTETDVAAKGDMTHSDEDSDVMDSD